MAESATQRPRHRRLYNGLVIGVSVAVIALFLALVLPLVSMFRQDLRDARCAGNRAAMVSDHKKAVKAEEFPPLEAMADPQTLAETFAAPYTCPNGGAYSARVTQEKEGEDLILSFHCTCEQEED